MFLKTFESGGQKKLGLILDWDKWERILRELVSDRFLLVKVKEKRFNMVFVAV